MLGCYSNAQSWDLAGNTGTNPTSNAIGTNDNQDLIIKTNNIERLRVNSTGSVGIGVAPSPQINLKVYGRSQFIANVDSDAVFMANNFANIDGGNSLLFLRYGQYQPNNPGIIDVSGMTSPTTYEQIFTLKANGKMGLGTLNVNCADCADYRLFVKDGIRTEKVKVDIAATNGWADYVFKKEYKLMPLKELEGHIAKNGHLPEIPSTDEAIKNGIELKEMNILLLKKIEELTLYTIDQEKRIEALENRMKTSK